MTQSGLIIVRLAWSRVRLVQPERCFGPSFSKPYSNFTFPVSYQTSKRGFKPHFVKPPPFNWFLQGWGFFCVSFCHLNFISKVLLGKVGIILSVKNNPFWKFHVKYFERIGIREPVPGLLGCPKNEMHHYMMLSTTQ